MQTIKVSNLNEYEYYLYHDENIDGEHKIVWGCLNQLPINGFRPDLISLEIIIRVSPSYEQTFIETFPVLQLPVTLQHIKIIYNSNKPIKIALPDLSLLQNLKKLELENLDFITFTDLPKSLLQLEIQSCVFSREINRQMLQNSFLPNGLQAFTLKRCHDIYALPLLPSSLTTLKVSRSGFYSKEKFIELEQLYNNISLNVMNAKTIRNNLNKRTLILRKQRHMSEYDDLMYVTSLRDADARFILDTAKEELKDFIGGRNKSKKQRKRRKNTRKNKH